MQIFKFSRHSIVWKTLLCYLLPLIIINIFYAEAITQEDRWEALTIGLVLTIVGVLIIFWMMFKWETITKKTQSEIQSQSIKNNENNERSVDLSEDTSHLLSTEDLQRALESNKELNVQIEALEKQLDDFTKEIEETIQQRDLYHQQLSDCEKENINALEQLQSQQNNIRDLQLFIADQKVAAEKKQQQIGYLETKVSDLTYEIKTLLKLAETHSSSLDLEASNTVSETTPEPAIYDPLISYKDEQIKTAAEATCQLQRCLDIAQKITGSHHFNSHRSHFHETGVDSFSLDLRRLSDRLRIENSCSIFLYSPKENQVLFVNNQIKNHLGWSPEKFTHDFKDILQDFTVWKHGIASLSTRSEAQIQLPFKTKAGQETLLFAHLALIPTGIFRHFVISVLYSP